MPILSQSQNQLQSQSLSRTDAERLAALALDAGFASWTAEALLSSAQNASCWIDIRREGAPELRPQETGEGVCEMGRPLGFALWSSVLDEGELWLVVVAPEARRQGHGRALMAKGLERAEARGLQSLFLEVETTRAPAIALYAAFGFEMLGDRLNYYGPGRHARVMKRASKSAVAEPARGA